MLRAQLKRVSLPASHRLPRTGNSLSKRTIASYFAGEKLPPVPVLRSTLWALAATATIYIGCAANDVRRDIQDAKRRGAFKDGRPSSYEDLEDAKRQRHYWHHRSHSSPASKWQPPGQMGEMLSRYNDAEKLVLGAVALNIALVGAGYFAPGPYIQYFAHIPVYSPSYTLLTSSFGHSGLLHVGMNSFAMLQLGPRVARSPTFEGNGSHFAAFYLSTGIISALGDHLTTVLPTRKYRIRRFVGSLGSSGIVMAMLGVFVTMEPHLMVSTIIPPGSYPLQNVVAAMAAFDLFGFLIGIPYVHFAHAAHLAGLGAGIAYAYYDGKKYIWQPSRRVAFNCMKRLNIV